MVFTSPAWVPQLPYEPPDDITLESFLQESWRFGSADHIVLSCGVSGTSYTAQQLMDRTDQISAGLASQLQWKTEANKACPIVVGVYAPNSIDFLSVSHAVHRLGGVVCLISTTATVSELEDQLRLADVQALFTSESLYNTAREAFGKINKSVANIFLMDSVASTRVDIPASVQDLNQLVEHGSTASLRLPLRLGPGQGAKLPAFICFSSGTSGKQKAVLLSHHGIIANIMQIVTFERSVSAKPRKTSLCLLPLAHSYGLVPTIAAKLLKSEEFYHYDLGSVENLYLGGTAIPNSLLLGLRRAWPSNSWSVIPCYGSTEAGTAVSVTASWDICRGSVGNLLPGVRAKLSRPDGSELRELGQPGELWLSSPSLALGYLSDDEATKATFVTDEHGVRWFRSGDAAMFALSPREHEHLFIVDRLKDLIKVKVRACSPCLFTKKMADTTKGMQVSPMELEEHLHTHVFVDDAAVVSRIDSSGEERPQAFVVKSAEAAELPEERVSESIHNHVKSVKARHKWLYHDIKFLDTIPVTSGGKKLRRVLRDAIRSGRGDSKIKAHL
ncbi:phenylacetyl ligase [Fusarium phyllophilum]|uniref:Phenylacetyl ligase n=1 Tax=Fusarium phyllophilum TaxID=47803 RepID=A0A8H5MIX7_9HYPO|nr:phenylacetyl ligase [Fusarium phyllophilum]